MKTSIEMNKNIFYGEILSYIKTCASYRELEKDEVVSIIEKILEEWKNE